MSIRVSDYELGYKIVSIVLDDIVKDDLMQDDLEFLFVSEDKVVLFPANIDVLVSKDGLEKLKSFNNYDICEIWENGIVNRLYDNSSLDNYFFITGKCNSNCIMCPSPENLRKKAIERDMGELVTIAKHIPIDTNHLTITGGEPFIVGDKIFEFLMFLREKFINTEFLILTNGRIFAVNKYVELLKTSIPCNTIVGIPLHGASSEIHDNITQVKDSFNQTLIGVKRLLHANIRVELRVVISKLNLTDFDNIAKLIIKEIPHVEYISVIAMEMTGNAYVNKESVWISYREAFDCISESITYLIENGIDVRLYNFPLCTVKKAFWTLCEKSISPNKVRYAPICEECRVKDSCGGVFTGTYAIEKEELERIL